MGKLATWRIDYWDSQRGQQTCRDCGTVGPSSFVQPQLPQRRADLPTWRPFALCCDCITAHNRQIDQERKATLAAMDRCEIDGCECRGTWRVGGVLICGRHLRKVKRAHAKVTADCPVFCFTSFGRAEVLQWAE